MDRVKCSEQSCTHTEKDSAISSSVSERRQPASLPCVTSINTHAVPIPQFSIIPGMQRAALLRKHPARSVSDPETCPVLSSNARYLEECWLQSSVLSHSRRPLDAAQCPSVCPHPTSSQVLYLHHCDLLEGTYREAGTRVEPSWIDPGGCLLGLGTLAPYTFTSSGLSLHPR